MNRKICPNLKMKHISYLNLLIFIVSIMAADVEPPQPIGLPIPPFTLPPFTLPPFTLPPFTLPTIRPLPTCCGGVICGPNEICSFCGVCEQVCGKPIKVCATIELPCPKVCPILPVPRGVCVCKPGYCRNVHGYCLKKCTSPIITVKAD